MLGVGGRARITSMASEEAIARAHAGTLLKEIAAVMGGKGGGKPSLAQGEPTMRAS